MKVVFRAEEKKVVIGEEDKPYEWLVYPFHSSHINGLDLCLKKQLVATCNKIVGKAKKTILTPYGRCTKMSEAHETIINEICDYVDRYEIKDMLK